MNRKTGIAALASAALIASAAVATLAHSASAATLSHPFPFHVQYKVGVLPSASQSTRDAAVQKQYDSWKATYLVHGWTASPATTPTPVLRTARPTVTWTSATG